jgi:hypothetical protein
MWLSQFVFAPQFFKTPKGLCGHTVASSDTGNSDIGKISDEVVNGRNGKT